MVYKIKVDYTVDISSRILEHTMSLWCNADGVPTPGTPPANVDLQTKAGGLIAFDSLCTTVLAGLLGNTLSPASAIGRAYLWQYDDPDGSATLISEADIGIAGADPGSARPASQISVTFRTNNGKRGMWVIMESVIDSDVYDRYPIANTRIAPIGAYMLDSSSVATDKYGQYITSVVGASYGQNEVIWRKRFRDF